MKRLLAALPLLAALTHAQTAPLANQPAISPAAAYREALRPFDTARQSMANWSPTEQAAYSVAVHRATMACAAEHLDDLHNTDLLEDAHLCALGLNYSQSVAAGRRFLASSPDPAKLPEAYALVIDGELHLHDKDAALDAANSLVTLPRYTPATSDATGELLGYLELLFTPEAVTLATRRQPLILTQLTRRDSPAKSTPDPPLLDRAQLYRDGLRLPVLQNLANQPAAAQQTLSQLDAALTPPITPDEQAQIAPLRARYALLGQPLPAIPWKASLLPAHTRPTLTPQGAALALLLFPDWCAQCIRMARDLPLDAFTVKDGHARAFALLAETVPQSTTTASSAPDAYSPNEAELLLKNTATLTIDPTLLDAWGATEVPLLIIADTDGIVRFAEPVDAGATQPAKTLDSAIALVNSTWPPRHRVPTTVRTPRQPPSQHPPLTVAH